MESGIDLELAAVEAEAALAALKAEEEEWERVGERKMWIRLLEEGTKKLRAERENQL